MSLDRGTPQTPRRISTEIHSSGMNVTTPPVSPRRRSAFGPMLKMISPQNPESVHFEETERQTTQIRETRRSLSLSGGFHRRHTSVLTEASNWHGSARAKLVYKGYQSLAVMTTFVAAVQAQLLQMSYNQTDTASQVVNMFFFTGLFADIGASILSAASARWFEMLTPSEAEHVYDWFFQTYPGTQTASPEGSDGEDEERGNVRRTGDSQVHPTDDKVTKPERNQTPVNEAKKGLGLVERWVCIGLKSGLYVALLGLGCLASGVMVFVWAHTTPIVRTFVTVACVSLALLIPPFFLPHDRVRTLKYVRLHRYSG